MSEKVRRKSCCRKIKEERIRPLSNEDVLTPEEVACELKKNRTVVKSWLTQNNLIHRIMGSPRVIWGEVLAVIKNGGQSVSIDTPSKKIPLSKEF
jgi:hypothetical protein